MGRPENEGLERGFGGQLSRVRAWMEGWTLAGESGKQACAAEGAGHGEPIEVSVGLLPLHLLGVGSRFVPTAGCLAEKWDMAQRNARQA